MYLFSCMSLQCVQLSARHHMGALVQIICYHKETAAILGVGNSADDAITDARWNANNPEIPDSSEAAWRTIPADDALIDAVYLRGGEVRWHVADGVAVLT